MRKGLPLYRLMTVFAFGSIAVLSPLKAKAACGQFEVVKGDVQVEASGDGAGARKGPAKIG